MKGIQCSNCHIDRYTTRKYQQESWYDRMILAKGKSTKMTHLYIVEGGLCGVLHTASPGPRLSNSKRRGTPSITKNPIPTDSGLVSIRSGETVGNGDDRGTLPEYTISFVTTSTSYRTRGLAIPENISISSRRSDPRSRFGTEGDVGVEQVDVAVSGAYSDRPVPIIYSYASSLERVCSVKGRHVSKRDWWYPGIGSVTGDTVSTFGRSERLSRLRFSR